MISDDVLVTDTAEPDAKPEAAKQQKNEASSFLDELARSQSRKKLDLIGEIELHVETLEAHLKQRLDSFLQSESLVLFEEMALFETMPVLVNGLSEHTVFLTEVDELTIGCFVIENSVSRMFLSAALTGKLPQETTENDFSKAETRLFLVFASLLNTAICESFENVAAMGVPKKAAIVDGESFTELARDDDWVCLRFNAEFCDTSGKLTLLVPLALLSGEFPSLKDNAGAGEIVIDGKWQSALFDNIEKLEVPLLVELGSLDLPLSDLENLTVGQSLEMQVKQSDLMVFTEEGQALMRGGLEANGKSLELKVIEKVE